MNNFLQSLDLELLNVDFSLLFSWGYLTETNPETFSFSGWFTLLVVLNLLLMASFYVLLRRKAIKIIGKRKVILRKIMKYNTVFSLIWMCFIILRLQGVEYLSMRIWHLIFLIILLIGNCLGLVMFFKTEKVKRDKTHKVAGANYYQDYLPKTKKNKKRKH
jgi:hypothetical protein